MSDADDFSRIDGLVELIRDELGLPVTAEDANRPLDELPGWDSFHLVWLAGALESGTGRRMSLPDLLQAPTLADLHAVIQRSGQSG